MSTTWIPFKDTNYFSSLICDYLEEKLELQPFYNRFPKLENFKKQIEEKETFFSEENRFILTTSLQKQNEFLKTSTLTQQNIEVLKHPNTFTVTTGHQLNIFTGPLYFFYKIITTINLAKQLKAEYSEYNFVPIYWMATEDHDFDEINFFNFQGRKMQWNREVSGAVGQLDLQGLDHVFEVFSVQLGHGTNANDLRTLFKNAYTQHRTLSRATRFLVNELFKDYGLVIADGDDVNLKRQFIPYIEKELLQQTTYSSVNKDNAKLKSLNNNYKIQVNPREINLFYNTENSRERIVKTDKIYHVNNTQKTWAKDELLKEVNQYPDRFSPNVILRPLYQEVVLPNLCYIGGGGELAYWLQLKSNFETLNIPFPMLLLRNSAVIITQKQQEKIKKLNLSIDDLFLKQSKLTTKITKDISKIAIDFSSQKEHLHKQFKVLYELANQTDASFFGAVSAQEKKQTNGLKYLEKRLLKAQKRKLKDVLNRITILQNELFPNQSLQERYVNFSEFYLQYGKQFIPTLIQNLQPLQSEFLVLTII